MINKLDLISPYPLSLSFSSFASFSDLCWGKAVVAYTKPQQRKKEESNRVRGERDQIKFIDLRFEMHLDLNLQDSCQ